jgi:general secretion pathway protein E
MDVNHYQNLIDGLLQHGFVSEQDIAKANRLANRAGATSFPYLLLDLGLISESDLADQLAQTTQLKRVLLSDISSVQLLDNIPERFLKQHSIASIYSDDREVGIAVVDPYDDFIVDSLRLALNKQVTVHVGVRSEIEKAVNQQCEQVDTENHSDESGYDAEDIEHLRDIASEAPVIRYVNTLFQRAVDARASDIHLETANKRLTIRLRIDGILKELEQPTVGTTVGIISRIKLLAKLNIAERRLPQDGRIKYQINGKEFDMRISTSPTIHGEGVVIRLLDRAQVKLDFEALGFEKKMRSRFLEVLTLPHGVLLITGPTGSGKTSTLYTALTHLNNKESKIITVEDPVEYELSGINQIQVKPDIGLGFNDVLRSIVRQDPDIIMIGEMRDAETAEIAVQSALTGHLVLSTLHTNDAASGLVRLLDMGVDDFLLSSTVNGILAQRLVRKLCPSCKASYQPSQQLIEDLKLSSILGEEQPSFYSAVGCDACDGTGYRGRLAIMELLVMTENIKQQVMSRVSASVIASEAVNEGMVPIFNDGIYKVASGLTSLEEVKRVTRDH